MLNDVTFVLGQGGLGRPLPGSDYISGLLFYTANGNLPSGWTTSARVKALYSVEDAENAGILDTNVAETKATGIYTLTNVGANADTINFKFTEPEGVIVDLGTFAKTAAETTVTLLAAAIKAVINAGTATHGYTADNTAGALTITVRAGLGVFPNSGSPLTVTLSSGATIAGSLTSAFAGGVASLQDVWHYHIAEFFRIQPKGNLFVGFFAVPSPYVFTEIQTMQEFSNGSIRQLGVFKDGAAYAAADLTAIQAICTTLRTNKMPLSVLYGANLQATSDITALVTLAGLTAPNVSAVISQDGAALGNTLWYAFGKSITNLGAALGAVALAAVHEDIAWVAKFNISNGTENDTIAFANGVKFTDSSITLALLTAMDTKRFIFLRKFTAQPGSYFNDSHTAVTPSSDYAYIENNRTIDKALRGIYATMVPLVGAPINLNADGTLQEKDLAYFQGQAEVNLNQMVRDGELSAFAVTLNPAQDVLTTSKVIIAVQLLPVGVARMITVNIGFTTSIS